MRARLAASVVLAFASATRCAALYVARFTIEPLGRP
jgi:hypothetical protein